MSSAPDNRPAPLDDGGATPAAAAAPKFTSIVHAQHGGGRPDVGADAFWEVSSDAPYVQALGWLPWIHQEQGNKSRILSIYLQGVVLAGSTYPPPQQAGGHNVLEDRLTLAVVNAFFEKWYERDLFNQVYKELDAFAAAALGPAGRPHPDDNNNELPSDAFYKHVLWQGESRTNAWPGPHRA